MLIAFVGSLLGLHLIIRIFPTEVSQHVFQSGYLLQIFTVFVLMSSIVILAISNFLQAQQLSTLIAAISGYVLGHLGKNVNPPQAPRPPPPSPPLNPAAPPAPPAPPA